jgi:hypothetical protein
MRTKEELTYLIELMKITFKIIESTESHNPFDVIDNVDRALELFEELISVAVDPQFKSEAEEKRDSLVNFRQFVLDNAN